MQAPDLTFKTVLLAGAGGGIAEILWVAGYAIATPASGLEVARGVTQTIFPAATQIALAPFTGIAIHMLLSIGLACLLTPLLRHVAARYGTGALLPAALAALAGVWALNFLLILPMINPAFVALMPAAVTLGSKLLFGAAMAWMLKMNSGPGGSDMPMARESTATH